MHHGWPRTGTPRTQNITPQRAARARAVLGFGRPWGRSRGHRGCVLGTPVRRSPIEHSVRQGTHRQRTVARRIGASRTHDSGRHRSFGWRCRTMGRRYIFHISSFMGWAHTHNCRKGPCWKIGHRQPGGCDISRCYAANVQAICRKMMHREGRSTGGPVMMMSTSLVGYHEHSGRREKDRTAPVGFRLRVWQANRSRHVLARLAGAPPVVYLQPLQHEM
ncbi:hypothetical protein GY45DRAFT_198000 [Cubamyces sp. BRFM 1775]|nr:hypothetical protein GY45DRAFT_198000 [Cubamyces sp. BRFM 1775]